MHNLVRFRNLAIAAALMIAPSACKKNDPAHEADRAADRLNSKTEDLKDEAKDLDQTARDKSEDLADKAGDKAKATAQDMKDLAQDTRDRADEAVDKTVDQAQDVAEDNRARQDDVADKARDTAKDVADEAKDVGAKATDLERAQLDFERTRSIRVESLRAEHAVLASQTSLISTLAQAFPLVDADRGKVNEKLQIFQMRADEAGNAIQTLQGTDSKTWKDRDDEASRAMSRLNDARKDAWDALADAKRLDRTSMR